MARRLSAILAADVVGYSALMAQDEAGTLSALNGFRKTALEPLIAAHRGRVVKLMGDGLLAEFASVVDAVEFAIAFQQASRAYLDGMIRLRIGINLGDILIEGADIFGDGVNVAARLEALAEPGGICIAGVVMESLGNRVEARFTDDGMHALKNLPRPVRVYRWAGLDPLQPVLQPEGGRGSGKPSIAVLAFDNMSGDREQEYFSDGIAEDIITALSYFKDFFVIARNTSFSFKGQPVRVDQISAELGVQYVLEGSVRKADRRVRVTAQLIDGESGAHLWAAKYDRDLDDIFAVQDEITRAIVSAVAPETLGAALKRARAKGAGNLTAWDRVLQARWHLGHLTRDENQQARAMLQQALQTDPDMSEAHAALALCDLMDMLHLWQRDTIAAIRSAGVSAATAVALDDQNAAAWGMLGMADAFARDFDAAQQHLQRAIELNPNLAIGHGNFAAVYGVAGDYARARDAASRAIALSPRDPLKPFWLGGMGIGAYVAEAYEDCVRIARQGLKDHPGYASLMRQEAAALAMLGRRQEAAESVARLLDRMPGLTVSQVRKMVPVRYAEDHERWLDGLRRAGLPE